ncbi:putative tRNA -methyltransferase [Camelus dromedarius]|uniref:tRNA (uracil-O(2)-)-methyltransferase n=1 Tax=Camelus dromedarius TaxID=9838 RepID=A0A5N4EHC9_CAMDR|nr:putative tRNA -methyltransferase [Camelus dromedarius]
MKYSKAYQELKEKYKGMVKVWPEVTDPEKFVYEDVAIAAYLLILWEEERAERGLTAKQSFVDLGCGNGLLVHILSIVVLEESGVFRGQVRGWTPATPLARFCVARNAGAFVGECLVFTGFLEGAVTPNDNTLFPEADWLIGNHSDELTPWIPVIAARSSYHCRFFVLPCCFFDFIGKYQRRQSTKTQYRGYLDFLTEVGSACGFRVEEDCLRIPSTKRVCLIGKSRTYPAAAEASMDEQRTRYIRSLSLAEVASELDRETLQRLKRECGGLQTLLRNSHQVFQVVNGQVRIRDWREEKLWEEKELEARKTRICWFFTHHPDGCVLPSDCCPFAHGPGELRPAPATRKKRQLL